MPLKASMFLKERAVLAAALCVVAPRCFSQTPQAPPPAGPTVQDRIARMMSPGTGAWTTDQFATMAKLRDAALTDPYALNELRHLTDNIGPRLSGSPQAQTAVEYVAAEMKALGAEVTLEKTSVPHWVRGIETGELTAWPGMSPGTHQKVFLTALGSSVATAPAGLTTEVIVVDDWAGLKALDPTQVKGKIV